MARYGESEPAIDPWLVGKKVPKTKSEYKALGIRGNVKDGIDDYYKKWAEKQYADYLAAEKAKVEAAVGTYTHYKTGEVVKQSATGGKPPKAIEGDELKTLEWRADHMAHNKAYNENPEYRDKIQKSNGGGFFNSDKLSKLGDFALDTAKTAIKGGAILGSAYGANALSAGLQGIPMGAAAGAGSAAGAVNAGAPTAMTYGGTTGMANAASAPALSGNALAGTAGLKTAQVGVPGSVNGVSTMGAGPATASTGPWSPAAGTATTAAGATAATTAGMNAANTAINGGNALSNVPSWVNPALIAGSSLVSGYLANDAADDATDEIKRQYDQNRADMEPWRQAGVNALADYQAGINQPNNMYGEFQNNSLVPQYQNNVSGPPAYNPSAALPQYQNDASLAPAYQATGAPPEYQNTAGAPPEYMDRSRFNFDMEEDEGYKFTRDQALQATDRMSRANNGAFSGGQATALQDRAAGVASQWSDQYRRAALGESQANYGRSMAEYGADTSRNQDIYGRGVQDWNIGNARNQDIYGRNLQDYQISDKRNQDRYSRGVQDYGINSARNSEMYNRGTQDWGINNSINQDRYGRQAQDYSLARQGNLDQYGRDVGNYSMGVARNTDDYNRTQNTLNRQQGLAGFGQTTMAGLGNQGAAAANSIAGINIGAAGATNQAIQGGLSNYLSYQDQQNNPGVPSWMKNYYKQV